MSEFNSRKSEREEEEVRKNKMVRPSKGKKLTDGQIKRMLWDRLQKKRAECPELYAEARVVCEKFYIKWNLDKEEPTLISPQSFRES